MIIDLWEGVQGIRIFVADNRDEEDEEEDDNYDDNNS